MSSQCSHLPLTEVIITGPELGDVHSGTACWYGGDLGVAAWQVGARKHAGDGSTGAVVAVTYHKHVFMIHYQIALTPDVREKDIISCPTDTPATNTCTGKSIDHFRRSIDLTLRLLEGGVGGAPLTSRPVCPLNAVISHLLR